MVPRRRLRAVPIRRLHPRDDGGEPHVRTCVGFVVHASTRQRAALLLRDRGDGRPDLPRLRVATQRSKFLGAAAVGLYIFAACFATSSATFANPAVTVARAFTNSFTGIAPSSLAVYIAGQLIGGVVGVGADLAALPPTGTDSPYDASGRSAARPLRLTGDQSPRRRLERLPAPTRRESRSTGGRGTVRPSTKPRDWTGPIFLSIGYAACHWCHVMAHESFEDPAVAAMLNEHFVPVKVDREERPDVDALYMAATQLVSGHGGWPMSVFLLPDGRPFMAGTYYPPVERHGQASFTTLLTAMHEAWTTRRDAVERQAEELSRALEREVSFIDHLAPFTRHPRPRDRRDDDSATTWSRASTPTVASVTRRSSRVRVTSRRCWSSTTTPRASRVERTLDAMSRRGLYDHLRGGFARYSVDARVARAALREDAERPGPARARVPSRGAGPCPSIPSGARSPSTRSTSS